MNLRYRSHGHSGQETIVTIYCEVLVNMLMKLFECFFTWRLQPSSEEELSTAQVVLGQSFGLPPLGTSNSRLGQLGYGYAAMYKIPLVLQWEIAENLFPFVFARDKIAYVVRKHHIPGKYLDTYEVLDQAVKYCRQQGWTRAIILAHPDHMWRCAKVAERMGMQVLIPPDAYYVCYDPESEQKWTRSAFRFVPREIVARLMFLMKGWI